MKDRILIYLSLALSLAALCYAGWLHGQAQSMADVALKQREKRFVEAMTPRVQQVYDGMGITNRIDHPRTLDELFGPYLDTVNRMVGTGGTDR
jgi:hypothetical protein